jgi:hypothetical protein
MTQQPVDAHWLQYNEDWLRNELELVLLAIRHGTTSIEPLQLDQRRLEIEHALIVKTKMASW